MKTQPKWNKETVKELILKNDRAVERALLVVFKNQTADEKRHDTVAVNNNKGFRPCDARKGSYYAKWVQTGRKLTGHHLDKAREMATHYTRQLLEEITAKGAN